MVRATAAPRPVGFSLAMRSHVSLWSGPRLALTRRRGPLICFGDPQPSSGVGYSLRKELLAAKKFPDARPMQPDLLRDFSERQASFLRPLETLQTLCVCLADLALEIGLSAS